MKKNLFSFVFILFPYLVAFPQISLTYQTHAISTVENNEMVICGYADPGQAGQNVTWDFSGLKALKDFTGFVNQHYMQGNDPGFSTSNIRLTEFDNTFYFNITKDKMEETGMTSSDKRITIKYDQPFVKMKFPFSAGDAFAGSISGTYSDNGIKAAIDGSYSVEADAYGKLILPGNVVANNTLRVKSVKNYSRIFSGSVQNIEIVTYRWYNKYNRYPLLVLTSIKATTGNSTSESHQAAYNNKLKSSPIKSTALAENDLSLYPNPVIDKLTVRYYVETAGPVLIELFDNTGKKIKSLQNNYMEQGNYSFEINTKDAGLPTGMYFIRAVISGNPVSKEFVLKD